MTCSERGYCGINWGQCGFTEGPVPHLSVSGSECRIWPVVVSWGTIKLRRLLALLPALLPVLLPTFDPVTHHLGYETVLTQCHFMLPALLLTPRYTSHVPCGGRGVGGGGGFTKIGVQKGLTQVRPTHKYWVLTEMYSHSVGA